MLTTLLLLSSLQFMFIPDNQERLLSDWLTSPGQLAGSQWKVSSTSSAGHAHGSGCVVLAQLLSFGMGSDVGFLTSEVPQFLSGPMYSLQLATQVPFGEKFFFF